MDKYTEIEHLYNHSITDNYGGYYGFEPPSTTELMYKINELIDQVNKLSTEIAKHKEDLKWKIYYYFYQVF